MPPSPTATSERTADRCDISRVAFVSLGCPKNLVDSEQMLGTLSSAGFELVSNHDEADAIIINTCGFLEASKDESLEVIHEAIERKKSGTLKRVIVAGCLVQRHRAKMLEWAPGIDTMIGVFDRDHVIDAVGGPPNFASGGATSAAPRTTNALTREPLPKYWIAGNALQAANERKLNTTGLTVHGKDGKGLGYFEDDSNRLRLTPRHWAYLRVSEGCNQKCAFCTIPSIRGKMRSKPLERIVSEARNLMADGAFELNLIGQDTTSYGYDIGYDNIEQREGLIGLLESLDKVANEFGGGWMRLMYVYPTYFTDEMIDCITALKNIVNYIDIPLQHMSNNMLQTMRRNITRQEQEDLLHKLREHIPGLAIRTTFITGFPGETEEDHEELMEFIEEFGFDMMGVFQYSREPGTPAGRMDLDESLHVPDEVKERRERELMLLQQEIAFENAAYVAEQHSQFDVLVDEVRAEGNMCHAIGRCYHQAPQVDSITQIASKNKLTPGELVRCTIVDSDGYDLIARPTDDIDNRTSLPIL